MVYTLSDPKQGTVAAIDIRCVQAVCRRDKYGLAIYLTSGSIITLAFEDEVTLKGVFDAVVEGIQEANS